MKSSIHKILLAVLFLLATTHSFSRYDIYKYSGGISLGSGIRTPSFSSGVKHSLFTKLELNGFLFLEGIEYNSFSLLLNGGVQVDNISYTLEKGMKFNMEIFRVGIHPQAAISSNYTNLKYMFGFGIDYILKNETGVSIMNINRTSGFNFDLDKSFYAFRDNMRVLIPYLSGGIYFSKLPWKWGENLNIFAGVKQPVLNLFENPVPIEYYSSSSGFNEITIKNYYPLFITFTVGYRIRNFEKND